MKVAVCDDELQVLEELSSFLDLYCEEYHREIENLGEKRWRFLGNAGFLHFLEFCPFWRIFMAYYYIVLIHLAFSGKITRKNDLSFAKKKNKRPPFLKKRRSFFNPDIRFSKAPAP